MRHIPPAFTEALSRHVGSRPVAQVEAFPVSSFRALMEHVARLAYLNKDHLLFYRGQTQDYRNKAGASTLYPGIYRGERVERAELDVRFDVLRGASTRLKADLKSAQVDGHADVRRRRYIQWSILQHYEVCPTPLLDVTHSLRVACSFAHLAGNDEAFIFVLGLPYFTNRISLNTEHDIVNVRLLSICPPDALRPYFQDGYVVGTDEITNEFDSKDELDFNNRLIAKFRFNTGRAFWSGGFSPIPREALFPSQDRIQELCSAIKEELGTELELGRLGSFLHAWTHLERMLLTAARERKDRVFSLREAMSLLMRSEDIPEQLLPELENLRKIRNQAVHEPGKVGSRELADARRRTKALTESLEPWVH